MPPADIDEPQLIIDAVTDMCVVTVAGKEQ
jgi:hypothetical protein